MMLLPKDIRRSLGWWLLLEGNRLMGRSWAPHPRREIFIEPTSTCNLGCRFCAYEKGLRARVSMSQALFEACASQAAALGFSRIYLTPQTGDVFMDKGLEQKLAFVEGLDGVSEIGFFTNLAAATPARLDHLATFTKLFEMQISLYGADEAGFVATTRRPPSQFHALLANLDHLAGMLPRWRPRRLCLVLRVGEDFRLERWAGPLAERVSNLQNNFGIEISTDTEYDDWGGQIAQQDVADLGIRLTPGRNIYKKGACIKALGQVLIHADGKVDACACRDAVGALELGDVTTTALSDILSLDNERYRRLLDGMDQGRFPDPCRKCSVYRSVYDPRWVGEGAAVTLAQALAILQGSDRG